MFWNLVCTTVINKFLELEQEVNSQFQKTPKNVHWTETLFVYLKAFYDFPKKSLLLGFSLK